MLGVAQLYRPTVFAENQFADTRDLSGNSEFLGQKRVKQAFDLALSMRHDGYNLFAVGPRGLGKKTMLLRKLRQIAAAMPTPDDWCYVNNFDDPRRPLAIAFPAGQGLQVRQEMLDFWHRLTDNMAQAFETDSYAERIESLKGELSQAQQRLLAELSQRGEAQRVKLVLRTPGGYGFAPMNQAGEVMGVDEFNALAKAEQTLLKKAMQSMEGRLRSVTQVLFREEQMNRDKIRQLNQEVAQIVLLPELTQLRQTWGKHKAFISYLQRLKADILKNIELVLNQDEQQDAVATVSSDNPVPSRYQINVIVAHTPGAGAPVVLEDLPTHYNLLGHVEQVTYMGTVATDFTLIRAGALHRANGGFLLLEAEQVLEQPYAWQGLKRALAAKKMRFSSLEQMLTLTGTLSLEADPIALQVKIILFGDRETFALLQQFDPELADYFKVVADFATTMPRTPATELAYAHYLSDFVSDKALKPFNRAAVERILEESARWAEDRNRLALQASMLADLLREAEHVARRRRSRLVQREHVESALSSREQRHGALHEELLENLHEGQHLFSTAGQAMGQVHGLSVLEDAGFVFGLPSRITVTTHYGTGDILDIEREVDLGGAIHSKGVLILAHYLKSVFGQQHALRFSASIAFEQSYGPIDGDSASLAELCALVSALAGRPIAQRFAVTGSVNQKGEVQPIGGVNHKIEGFFAACTVTAGLCGQAVIIPQQNVQHLMLRAEVIAAVQQGKFFIYGVHRVEEAMELLMNGGVGERLPEGNFTPGSIFAAVEQQLEQWRNAEPKEEEEAED